MEQHLKISEHQQQHPEEEDPRKMQSQAPMKVQSQQHSPGLESQMTPKPDYGYHSYVGSNRLQGKVAIVTGGDSGIGRAVCVAFAREGCNVVISYLNEHQDAQETRDAILSCPSCPKTTTTTGTVEKEKSEKESKVDCLLVPGDISENSVCQEIIEKTVQKFGKIDILVNNAAYQGKALEKFEDLSYERILYTFKVNIVSMFSLVHYALPHMQAGGSILNVGAIQSCDPSPSIIDYATTKGAIENFTKGLSQFTIQKGIRCNCIAPGVVWTPLMASSYEKKKLSEFGKLPLERPAQPAQLSPAFVFLASKDASFMNGQILNLTGGGLMP